MVVRVACRWLLGLSRFGVRVSLQLWVWVRFGVSGKLFQIFFGVLKRLVYRVCGGFALVVWGVGGCNVLRSVGMLDLSVAPVTGPAVGDPHIGERLPGSSNGLSLERGSGTAAYRRRLVFES